MDRITELEKLIKHHQHLYYNGTPEISDADFDALWDELKQLEPDNELFNVVGKDNSSDFEKGEHIINMSSQEKVNTEEDYIAWHKRRLNDKKSVVEYKLDGISLELQYAQGHFSAAITRGNGRVGDVITRNAMSMQGFIFDIPDNSFTGGIRAEVVLYKSTFEEVYKPQGYANPRNMASGLAKQRNGEGCENLTIIVYDAESYGRGFFNNEEHRLNWLEAQGFFVVPYNVADHYSDTIAFRNKTVEERNKLEFDIDGLVIKDNEIHEEDRKRARPEYQIAFKFDSNEEITTLLTIEWSVSGRILTPVAILSPIVLDGTTVRRASLANPDEIRRLDLHINDEVVVTKRGQIIPKIERVHFHNNGIKVEIPSEIIIENKTWKLQDEGARLVFEDTEFPMIKYHRLAKWIKKMDAKGFGDALLSDLFDKEVVREIPDFYTINLGEYLKTTNLKKATEKAFASLYDKSRESTLAQFISGYDIEGVGESVIQFAVDAGYDTFENLCEATEESLLDVDGIAGDRARRIVEGIQEHKESMEKLLATGKVVIKENKKEEDMGAKGLKGLSFCFTGALESMTRDEAFELVESKGGVIKKSMSGSVDYLVTNTPTNDTSKNRQADSLGIKKITENHFLKMVATR